MHQQITEINVADLQIGEQAKIVGYSATDAIYREQLMALGFTKGAILELKQRAPLGDPLAVQIRGTLVSLRKQEAKALRLQRVSNG